MATVYAEIGKTEYSGKHSLQTPVNQMDAVKTNMAERFGHSTASRGAPPPHCCRVRVELSLPSLHEFRLLRRDDAGTAALLRAELSPLLPRAER